MIGVESKHKPLLEDDERLKRLQNCLKFALAGRAANPSISGSMNKLGEVVIVTDYKSLKLNADFEPSGFLTNLCESFDGT